MGKDLRNILILMVALQAGTLGVLVVIALWAGRISQVVDDIFIQVM